MTAEVDRVVDGDGEFWRVTIRFSMPIAEKILPVVAYGRGDAPEKTIRRAQADALEKIAKHVRVGNLKIGTFGTFLDTDCSFDPNKRR